MDFALQIYPPKTLVARIEEQLTITLEANMNDNF